MSTPTTRRSLRFDGIEPMLVDVEALAAAEREGTLRSFGNWTLGQSLNHLASWVDFAYTGLPIKLPFFVRWLVRPLKKKMLAGPLRPGVKLPKTPGGTLATEVVPTDEGLAHLRQSFARLAAEPPTLPHPLFGRLTHDEWMALHLRHAELHLSFLHPDTR
ncbi:DUF1569 domain-containing protein [Tundrisphaera sp. TA3]|uniref:DUF1569 domain-containing protein n=1 Tax=Tundrisphaera sp. TA3 TaxID=3435775 RepID=UPI003EBB0CFF